MCVGSTVRGKYRRWRECPALLGAAGKEQGEDKDPFGLESSADSKVWTKERALGAEGAPWEKVGGDERRCGWWWWGSGLQRWGVAGV